MNTFKKYLPQFIAEFIGTFFLVLMGCGSVILYKQDLLVTSSIPLIFGGIVAVMIYATGHISGAHFNPAVTISFWALKKIDFGKLCGFIFFQCLGAISASFIHFMIWGSEFGFGQTGLSVPLYAGFIIEFLLSFLLMFVIAAVATDSRAVGEMAGLAIGSTVALCAFIGGPLTGASMNPARSLAPALFAGEFNLLYLYFLTPTLGALAGAKLYTYIKCQRDENSEQGCC